MERDERWDDVSDDDLFMVDLAALSGSGTRRINYDLRSLPEPLGDKPSQYSVIFRFSNMHVLYGIVIVHSNLNKKIIHLTKSIETVQKRALKCISDILCLTNLQCLKERRDSLCKKYFQKIMETNHRLNYLLPRQRYNRYGVRTFNKYPLPEIRTNRYGNSLIPWGLFHWK